MNGTCPGFEVLSRFQDGALEAPEEGALVAHVAGCGPCLAALSFMDEVDGLLLMSLPSPPKKSWRPLRAALVPLAAAALFALTLAAVLGRSAEPSDSPIAVAELSPRPVQETPEPADAVFWRDQFSSPGLSPVWKTSETLSGTSGLTEWRGRRALSLSALPGGRKRWALVSTARDFSVGEGISFDVDYRIPRLQKGGRMEVLLQTRHPKAGRSVLRWSRTAEGEMLEAQVDGRSAPAMLWSSAPALPDDGWHALKLSVTPRDVVLARDGVEAVRKAHGLSMEHAGLTLGSTLDKRAKDSREPFECQVGGVVVRREPAR